MIITYKPKGICQTQGVDISDKHIEVVVSRMISKIRISDGGDTKLLIGSLVSMNEFTDANKEAILKGKKPAVGKPILLGITKASLETEKAPTTSSKKAGSIPSKFNGDEVKVYQILMNILSNAVKYTKKERT